MIEETVEKKVLIVCPHGTGHHKAVISDDEIKDAFVGSYFGTNGHRLILEDAVIKTALNYHNGSTINRIMSELGLIDMKVGRTRHNASQEIRISKKGIDFMREIYSRVAIAQ